jgi:hypothetical protein
MRKFLVFLLLLGAGALVVRRLRASSGAPARRPVSAPPAPPRPATPPQAPPAVAVAAEPEPAPVPAAEPEPPQVAEPVADTAPPTTNGERVVLMSISSLEGRGQDATAEAVVAHVAAGEIDPDEGAVEELLQRMAGSGLLSGGNGAGPYQLTATGRAALLDGSPARPSPAGDAADELGSPTTGA